MGLSAAFKTAFCLILVVACLVIDRPLFSLGALFLQALFALIELGRRPAAIWRFWRVPLLFIGISVLTIMLQVGGNPLPDQTLWRWGVLSIGRASSLRALGLGARALAAFAALRLLSLTLRLPDFLMLLKRWHCPGVFVTLAFLMYRLLFRLRLDLQALIEAQELRLGYRHLRTGLKALGMGLGTTFSGLFRHSQEMGEAMDLRFFDGNFRFLPRLPQTLSATALRLHRRACWAYGLLACGIILLALLSHFYG